MSWLKTTTGTAASGLIRKHVCQAPWFVTAGSSWVWIPTSAGQLWLTAACVQKGGLLRDAKTTSVVGA